MNFGKVLGVVVSTQKVESLKGEKLYILLPVLTQKCPHSGMKCLKITRPKGRKPQKELFRKYRLPKKF